jgi:hypothetical protein
MTELREPRLYPGGSQFFVKYQPGGNGSFAWYPSGRMACACERMGGGFYCFFYADNNAGTTLCAFDPQGSGYVAFEDGRPRLTSRKGGGTYTARDGTIERLWTTAKPLKGAAISFEVTNNITFSFKSCREITAKLSCQGLTEEYVLGEPPLGSQTSYISRSLGTVRMGPERGKKILDIDKIRLSQAERAQRAAPRVSELAVSKKGKIRVEDVHADCRSIVEQADNLSASVKRGDWDVDVYVDKAKLRSTLGDTLPTLRLDASLLRGDPASKKLDGMAATDPATLEQLLAPSTFPKGVLPLSKQIMGASGRFRPNHGPHYRTPRVRLHELKAAEYDAFLSSDAPKDAVVVVACLAGWLPQARRAEAMLELVNAELHAVKGSGGEPEFLLLKFDMSHSRMLRDRHNINTLPMYLMYMGGRLAFASNTLNGYGASKEDLTAQVRTTAAAARTGTFMPEGFKFGLTDNALVESFGKTLSATSTRFGAST